eukprot:CAMPEP_0201537330 /NCGR_PEP_ID=MMETSP0161_2-20130828/64439_1 /ASSEMBLY_ACC=CAM_ASM_000251 /TAXON_ID=180227 /ORGANISM="Neoparamoeba aestuarina, Strain SoJaBio B1-5/56/2" /LENGTH=427 /DNA_ID=CAMNT_0047943553 /DNA_START=34 /DNA_END=1317 /DNA_ORIENTATION=-
MADPQQTLEEDKPDVKYRIGNDGQRIVVVASLNGLILELTKVEHLDLLFRRAFFLCYRLFVSPIDVLRLLITRWENPGTTNEEYVKMIRLRTASVVKTWITQFGYDFVDDKMQQTFDVFINRLGDGFPPNLANNLLKQFRKTLTAEKEKREKEKKEKEEEEKNNNSEAVREKANQLHLGGWLDIEDESFAKQLTIIESKMFQSIPPNEFLIWGMCPKDRDEICPNLVVSIKHFNDVSRWVTSQIVTTPDKKDRIRKIQKFIGILDELHKLSNCMGIMEILSALSSPCVARMKSTWAEIGKHSTARYNFFKELVSPTAGYRRYREHVHSLIPPCIPYVGIYLTDLVFVLDSGIYAENNLIKFQKLQRASDVLQELLCYQYELYKLPSSPVLSLFMNSLSSHTLDEEEWFEMSLKVEPKQGAKQRSSSS